MALSAKISGFISIKIQASDAREGRRRILVSAHGRRELLLSSVMAAAMVDDSRTELLKRYLKKSEENKAKNDKERLDNYYKRNYRDYFGYLEGTLRQQDKEQLSEAEKGILEWLDSNK